MNSISPVVRYTLTAPAALDKAVKRLVKPNRSLNSFLVEAVQEKVERELRLEAIRAMETLPPAFPQVADSGAFVRALREESEERLSRVSL